jgi:hypothetical protein
MDIEPYIDRRYEMFALFIQLSITYIWAATFVVHARRLLRLAHIEIGAGQGNGMLRHQLDRIWWWLGRADFWRDVQRDCLQSLQLTLLIFLLATMV